MKTVFSDFNGAIVLTEDQGVFTLTFNNSIGGNEAAGIIKGSGSITINGAQALALGEKLLNSALPASVQPLASIVENIAGQAIAALE